MSFVEQAPTVEADGTVTLHLNITPENGSTTVTFTSGTEAKATVEKVDNKTVTVTGVAEGTSVITATSGTVTASVTVTVTA